MILHPLEPLLARRGVFWLLLAGSVALTLGLNALPLQSAAARSGIVSFEFAGTYANARTIVAAWEDEGHLAQAGFSLGLDYLYMVLYALTIGLACLWAGRVLRLHGWPLSGIGPTLAWGVAIAALFDATENVALLAVLFGPGNEFLPQVAFDCAIAKFTLIVAGLLYGLYGLVAWLVPVHAPAREERI